MFKKISNKTSHQQHSSIQFASPQAGSLSPKTKKPKRRWLAVTAVVIVAASVFFALYYWRQYKKIEQNPNAAVEKEVKKITEKIDKFMDLPADEQPTLATVSDKEKLKEQIFFAKAQNGDKVLIYQNAKKAILFRPSSGRVIEVMSLNSRE